MGVLTRARDWLGTRRPLVGRWFGGAEISRVFANWLSAVVPPDTEIVGELRTLRGRSRDLVRNNALAANMLRVWVSNVVGPDGLQHFPKVMNSRGALNLRVNNILRDAWADWGRRGTPTVDGRYSWVDLEELIVATEFVDGEFLALKVQGRDAGNPYGFALQLLDPEQLDVTFTRAGTPTVNAVRMGVEVDRFNRPVAYWLWEHTPGDIVPQSMKRIRVPADQVIHYYEQRRPGQTRGVPRLAPVMARLKALDAYTEAEVMSARIGAMMAMVFTQDKDAPLEDIGGRQQGKIPVDLEQAMSALLPPGVSAQMLTASHPSQNFEPFIRTVMREIASGVGEAYHTVTGDLSQSNYVSMRGGDLQQRDVYMGQQRRLATHVTEPIYRDWLRSSVLWNAIPGIPDAADWRNYAAVEFEGRGWSWTNPSVDLAAQSMALALGVTTRSAIAREQGRRYEDICRERQQDDAIEDQYGIELSDPLPAGVTESLSQAAEAAEDPDTPEPEPPKEGGA